MRPDIVLESCDKAERLIPSVQSELMQERLSNIIRLFRSATENQTPADAFSVNKAIDTVFWITSSDVIELRGKFPQTIEAFDALRPAAGQISRKLTAHLEPA